MSKPYLEVTYRRGKPFAAYLFLDRRAADTAARRERREDFVVDFAEDGQHAQRLPPRSLNGPRVNLSEIRGSLWRSTKMVNR